MGPLKTTEIGRHETINNLMEEKIQMKNRVIHAELNREQTRALHGRLPLNLQLFADDGGDNGDDGDDGGDDGDEDGDEDGEEDKPEKKYTEADVDKIVKDRLARERKAAERKARQQAEAEKLKSMTEKERHDAEFEQMKAEIAAMRAEKNRADMTATAGDILREAGIPAPSILVSKLVSDTAEDTKKTVEAFVKLFNEAVNKGVKAAMKATGSSPKRKGGSSDSGEWTKEKIYEVKDPIKRQQLIKEHWELFKN